MCNQLRSPLHKCCLDAKLISVRGQTSTYNGGQTQCGDHPLSEPMNVAGRRPAPAWATGRANEGAPWRARRAVPRAPVRPARGRGTESFAGPLREGIPLLCFANLPWRMCTFPRAPPRCTESGLRAPFMAALRLVPCLCTAQAPLPDSPEAKGALDSCVGKPSK